MLKYLPNALGVAIFWTTLACANDIHHITIYQGQALVERTAPVGLGEQQIVFDCLSANLVDDSLQIHTDASIGDIQIKNLNATQSQACHHHQQAQLDEIDHQLKAAQYSLDFLQNLSKINQLHLNNSLSQTITDIQNQSHQLHQTIGKLNAAKEKLQTNLPALKNSKQVIVRLKSTKNTQVYLRYLVQGAYWQPKYQARLDSTTGKLDLDLQAQIRQHTGERWRDVKLTLSNAVFSGTTESAPPNRYDLRIQSPHQLAEYDNRLQIAAAPMALTARTATKEITDDAFVINTQQTGDVVHYTPKARLNLDSGGNTTLYLDKVSLSADVFTRVNLAEESAYWFAKVARLGVAKNWLPASMQLYRDGVFVGQGDFDGTKLTQSGIGFGKNGQVIVTQQDNDNARSQAGLFGNKQRQNYQTTTTITNRLPHIIHLEALDGMLAAKDSQIEVKSTYQPTPTQNSWQNKANIAVWYQTLAPNQSLTIHQSHAITYPKDEQISGMPK